MTCPVCNDTGEAGQYGVLDCAAPGCTAAAERSALNAAMAALPPMSEYDRIWYAYLAGKKVGAASAANSI